MIAINNIQKAEFENRQKKFNNFKDLMFSQITHNLKTPLNGISLYIHLARDMNLNEDISVYLSEAENQCQFLNSMISDILDYSSFTKNEFHLCITEFDLDQLIDDLVNMYMSQIDYKNNKFYLQKNLNLPKKIKSDYNRIKQVMVNLMGNAVRFTNNGEIMLKLRLREGNSEIL